MAWKNDQVSEKETAFILSVARGCLGLSGDYVEMGCYRGDTSLLLAEALYRGAGLRQEVRCSVGARQSASPSATPPSLPSIHAKSASKVLWLYDSFEGLPEKSASDKSVVGEEFARGALAVTKREVKERFLRAGLRVPVIKKAWFADLKEADMPREIAFAFLDGDFYESIMDSLKLVGPRMVTGGVILVHDYANPALPGVKKAVDEWLLGEARGEITEECESLVKISINN